VSDVSVAERTQPAAWDGLARRMREPQFEPQIAAYKRRENLELIRAWAPSAVHRLLKTDLFEEGFGEDALLGALGEAHPVVVGMDISRVVVAAARTRIPAAGYVATDVAALPFRAGSFDLIVSISTLDHLPPALLPRALGELCRALTPGGCLVLTLDSRHNPWHVLSNALRRRLGRIHAERCYTFGEVRAALAGLPVRVAEETAIYHIPFPVNFLAKRARALVGAAADPGIRAVTRCFDRLRRLPTRVLTGRYIALRIVRTAP
jgi:SAM-dependent methyltransferase